MLVQVARDESLQLGSMTELTPIRQPDQSQVERIDGQQNGSDASLKMIQRKMQKQSRNPQQLLASGSTKPSRSKFI